MSAKLQPEWVERRSNIDPDTGARQKRFLVIGLRAGQIAAAFSKLMPNCHIEAATRADHAVLAMASGHFDATLVDCRDDERFHRLAVVAARQFKEGRVALLASDHFLPDEKAVLGNLDIFGSSDDSARLLASLQLVTKPPAAKKPAPQNADFEAALRAELDALQNKDGQTAVTASAPALAENLVEARAAPAVAPNGDVAPGALPNHGSEDVAFTQLEANFDQQAVENEHQSSFTADTGFLDALAFELGGIQLLEAAPSEPAYAAFEQRIEPDWQAYFAGNLDLFGHPAAEPGDWRTFDLAGGESETACGAGDGGLLAYFAAEARAPQAEDHGTQVSDAQKSTPAARAADWDASDLFEFPLGEIREMPSFDLARAPENFSDTLDLFDALPSQHAAAPETGEACKEGHASIALSALGAEIFHAQWPGLAASVQPALQIGKAAEPAVKTSLRRSTSWLAHLLPRLTPLYSIIYKNLALVILGALFTAFVAFGVMIVFFLTSNKWSAPITLSRGHELVIKVERELSDLNVRKNQISEQIDDAKKNLQSSQDDLGRARQLAGMIEGTISAEIKNRSEMRAEIKSHTGALRNVAAQYGNDTLNPQFKGNLEREFDRRLINRNIFEAGKLAQLEAAHRTALIRNEIAANQVEISRLNSTLTALYALSGHVEGTSAPIAGAGGADLVPLLNQVIEVRKGASEAASELKAAESRSALLSDSLETIEASVAQIESTPLARAINESITVLFVPYENAGQYEKGNSLYSCAIGIFICSEAGKVGKTIEGETVATHPFFNKPVRGSFVEAQLTDQDAARKEILHVKRRPLFF